MYKVPLEPVSPVVCWQVSTRLASTVEIIQAEDFKMCDMRVVMDKVRNVVLSKAKDALPTPEEQLALLRKAQGKEPRSFLGKDFSGSQFGGDRSSKYML